MVDDSGDLILTYKCNITETNDVYVKRNLLHLAPEVCNGFQGVTKAVDWWSYGSILYELLVGLVCITIKIDTMLYIF